MNQLLTAAYLVTLLKLLRDSYQTNQKCQKVKCQSPLVKVAHM